MSLKGLRVTLASLTETTDRTTVSSLHRVELEYKKSNRIAKHTFVAQSRVRMATKVKGKNYIQKALSFESNRCVAQRATSASSLDLID